MDKVFTIIERFAPEAIDVMQIRYQILRQVLHRSPIGRRQLCKYLGYTERLVRSEINLLKERGAVTTTPAGINITHYGEELLHDIDELIPFLFDVQSLAEEIKKRFHLDGVIIVPGDSFTDELAKRDLGRAAARYLKRMLYPGSILAVTGGTTLAEMANAIGDGIDIEDVLVVPARGGLGEEMEQQAGTIAAKIAKAIGAQYRLLHIPDNLEEKTARILKKDIHIKEMVNVIKSSNILIHGIGPAIEMANRRGLMEREIKYLHKKEAVGEVLRYYFDRTGKIVYGVPGIGLEFADLENIETVLAVAGGSNKAEAIKAVLSNQRQNILITDEGAAGKIVSRKGDYYNC
jgi:central glycolytic genes regulator